MPTRTTPRSTGAGRFGRTQPQPGRFGRTQPPAGRFGRSQPQAGRFARPSAHRSANRTISTPRIAVGRIPARRSKPDKGLSKLVGMLPGSMLGRAAKPSSRGGGGKGRKAGFAMLAGAAGLALKNRDRLPGPLGRRTEEPVAAPPSGPVAGDYVATPPVTDAGSPASTTPPPAV
ncbi:MAG TPA: hypothetical protein VGW75_03590 [Solirubrobacteraceae bacterium]|jgi:hypothetical protein|nr:hypothetical protein [Solirubrobacteraceae bacterium]